MKRPDILLANAGHLRTRMGACFPGTHAIFRGLDLHKDLREMDWLELYLFGITGRRFSPKQIELFHAIWVYTSYPDARLWNNRVAALAGSARSTGSLGITAAVAVSEATTYGGQAGLRAIAFLIRARKAVKTGVDLEAFVLREVKERRIYGFGRPINSTDERIPWMMDLVRRLGFDQGEYLKLAFEIERILVLRHPKLKMNYAALHAALVADMGLSEREYQLLRIPTFLAGMPPCYVEASGKTEGTVFPIPCDAIAYEGQDKREWPR